MTTTAIPHPASVIRLREKIEYPDQGGLSKVLVKDTCCQYTLFCLAAGTDIFEHTSPRNATVHVIEGQGLLTLEGHEIPLEPGVFIFMPANAPHAFESQREPGFSADAFRASS